MTRTAMGMPHPPGRFFIQSTIGVSHWMICTCQLNVAQRLFPARGGGVRRLTSSLYNDIRPTRTQRTMMMTYQSAHQYFLIAVQYHCLDDGGKGTYTTTFS